MEKIRKGDKVARISHEKDIVFEVKKIIRSKNGKRIAILKGITERIVADSELEDLCVVHKELVETNLRSLDFKLEKRIEQSKKVITKEENRIVDAVLTGKILHLDGDKKYSEKSHRYYKKIGLNAVVKNIAENKQPKVVYSLLQYYRPDILVITGHDRDDKEGIWIS